ncbi:BLK [Cervus elaphus hippelaphus]|uniref:BLK n=1 Tax=Cervus elaphus hippelaphus TaxID=46360 RepID=A0A212C5I3_CEREH|nr:BLK [Cervus elaphus hippelaphus]
MRLENPWKTICMHTAEELKDKGVMGVVSSKRQVKEKGRSGWSPVKTNAPGKEPPPLPPLVVFNHLAPPPPDTTHPDQGKKELQLSAPWPRPLGPGFVQLEQG